MFHQGDVFVNEGGIIEPFAPPVGDLFGFKVGNSFHLCHRVTENSFFLS